MIYSLGIELGLTVSDIDEMTAGEIIDLVYYKANRAEERQKDDKQINATQADYDNF